MPHLSALGLSKKETPQGQGHLRGYECLYKTEAKTDGRYRV